MVDEGESELLGKGCYRRGIHRGGEGHEDRVKFKREYNPPNFQKCGLVADRVAKDSTSFGRKAFLFGLAERETLHEVFKGGGVQCGPLVFC